MRDFIDIGEGVDRTTAPLVRFLLARQSTQAILCRREDGQVFFPPPSSATGVHERVRDLMWWKPSCLIPDESYEAFRKRANAQRVTITPTALMTRGG